MKTNSVIYNLIAIGILGDITTSLYLLSSGSHVNSPVISSLSYFWLLPLPMALVSVMGILLHGSPNRPLYVSRGANPKLIFRIVTKGVNSASVELSVRSLDALISKFSLKAEIEVVSDLVIALPSTKTRTKLLLVPKEYITSHGARFKARALNYALEVSDASDQDYLVHMDEETQISVDTIKGIYNFINKHADNPTCIGQGAIEYSRSLYAHPFLTLADSLRVADDLGRFRLMFKLGLASFGMKGSYIVILNALEKKLGFDISPKSSITEDAFFALSAMEQGYKFDFIDGFMHEQSPFTVWDFVKQRERWFKGLGLVLMDRRLKKRTKLLLSQGYLLWALSPLVIITTLINFIYPTNIVPVIRVLGNLTFSCYIFFYIYGFLISLEHRESGHVTRHLLYLVIQVACIPLYSLLETMAVVKGLTSKSYAFHVVQK